MKPITPDDLLREIEEEADEEEAAEKAEDAAPAEPEDDGVKPVPRTKSYTFTLRDAKTGKRLRAVIAVTVPDKEARQKLGRLALKFLGMSWLRAPTPEQARAYQLGEIVLACPKMPPWFFEAVQEDDDFREYVHRGVSAHALSFRFGDIPEGQEDKIPPRFSMDPVELDLSRPKSKA